MFNPLCFAKYIDKNNDGVIEKSEIDAFQQTQKAPSIFTSYLNSINQNVNAQEFGMSIFSIYQKDPTKCELSFKNKEDEEAYNKKVLFEASRCYAWKAENEEEFKKLFEQCYAEAKKTGNCEIALEKFFKEMPMTKPITMEGIKNSGMYIVNLPYFDDPIFSKDIDWSESSEVLRYLAFNENTFSQTPSEHLPKGFDPQKIIEKGRSIGLGIDKAHEKYTGKGMSYAIIDSTFPEHEALKPKEYNVSQYAKKDDHHYHGAAVCYIAQEIAPDADCYYYAINNGDTDYNLTVLDNLKSILEKNKTLPNDKKIRVVSMSMGLYGGEEAKKVVKELESQGVWVYYAGCPDANLGILGKIDPAGDPDDFNNYRIEGCGDICVNSGDRTVPDISAPDAYRHDSRASGSWAIPVLAGYYILACEADPSMTKERFMQLAQRTARTIESDVPMSDFNQNNIGFVPKGSTPNKLSAKVIDINALLQAIEDEKSGQK